MTSGEPTGQAGPDRMAGGRLQGAMRQVQDRLRAARDSETAAAVSRAIRAPWDRIRERAGATVPAGEADGASDGPWDELLERLDNDDEEANGPISRARASLEKTIAGMKLTPEETAALADELKELRELTTKLDEQRIEIAAFGLVSRGKSSVLNALAGREVFRAGATHGTTTKRDAHPWESAELGTPGLDGARLVLVDTPGLDEVGGQVRETLARHVARHADLLLFVCAGDLLRSEIEALSELRAADKPILLVFNQIDKYPPEDIEAIRAKIQDERVRDLIQPRDIVLTAARPDPVRVKVRHPDGTTTTDWERPEPIIQPLKLRILEVLEGEGKALVALNALLTAGDLHGKIVERKMAIRDEAANAMIWNYAIAKGAAVALNPIPVADMAGGLAVDIAMVMNLSRLYGLPLTRRTAIGLVKDMSLALAALGAVEVATRVLASGVKSALAGVTVLSGGLAAPLAMAGYGAIGVAQGGTAALSSYVIGRGAKRYLQEGGQWGKLGIKTVLWQILDEARADSVLDRIKGELKKKVRTT
jgi:GTPase SAR1 family protein